ncbi:hypothetical protein V6N13_053685 [Hibiscus sabdariffa]|uniref:Uncharacterized protein n=1 Tax=Hibiscus sabdariffa TaxID=183260 RepID=A0ABR2T6V2_9ROSI
MAEHRFLKVPTTSLPLTFFDTTWITCRLFFYEFPFPPSHFIENTLPDLKTSLSHALQQFFPFAGHLRLWLPQPPHSHRPYIHYENGDSVPFLVAESKAPAEFNHLIGRDPVPLRVDELRRFVPELPTPTNGGGGGVCQEQALMAIQVRALSHFAKSWAAICKSKGDSKLVNISPPDYSRDSIQDPHGIWSIFLKYRNEAKKHSTGMSISPPDNVRVSPVFTKSQVETLKKWIARNEIRAGNGVLMAAKAMGDAIKGLEEEPLEGAESWMQREKQVSDGGLYRVARFIEYLINSSIVVSLF